MPRNAKPTDRKAAVRKAPQRKRHLPAFDAGNYDVKHLFALARDGVIEPPGALRSMTEQDQRELRDAIEWLRGE